MHLFLPNVRGAGLSRLAAAFVGSFSFLEHGHGGPCPSIALTGGGVPNWRAAVPGGRVIGLSRNGNGAGAAVARASPKPSAVQGHGFGEAGPALFPLRSAGRGQVATGLSLHRLSLHRHRRTIADSLSRTLSRTLSTT